MVKVLNDPKTIEALMGAGAEPMPGTTEEFRAFLSGEIKKWGDIIRTAKITVD
jgi:tripartite-type tricarboxylate transporter receptor subunit TctC